jgi:hypothetical protein
LGADEGGGRDLSALLTMQRFSVAGPFFLNEKYTNNFSQKITWLLFQGDGFGEAASHQRSSRDFNRVFFCLSADAPEFPRPWAVSSPSGAVAADVLRAPGIAWPHRRREASTPQE